MKNYLFIVALLAGLVFPCWADTEGSVVMSGKLRASFSSWKGTPAISGGWSIIRDGETLYLQLKDSFRARKGPDVKILLSPEVADRVTAANALNGSVFLKLLEDYESPYARIRIALPEGADLKDYKSLVFHCEQYSKLWGTSPLAHPPGDHHPPAQQGSKVQGP